MFNKTGNILLLIITLIVFASCSSSKNTMKSKNNDDLGTKNFNFNLHFLEGIRQKALGSYEIALTNFDRAIKIDEEQAAVHFEVAGILMMMQDYAGALEYAKKAVEIDKTDNEFYKIMLSLAYQSNNLLSKSTEVYQSLIKSHPDKIQYYFELSNIYVLINKENEAIKVLNSAEKKFGITDFISVEKERIYLSLKDYKGATNEIEKLVLEYPDNIKYKTVLAELYLNVGNMNGAEKMYREIENSDIEDGLMYFSIADFYMATQNYDKFFDNLLKGFASRDVELDIKMKILVDLIDKINSDKRNLNNIKKLLDTLSELYPEDVTVKALYSDYYVYIGDFKSAQKELDHILSKDKNKYQIWTQALHIDYTLNDMDKMYERSKEAVELYPNVLELYKYYITSAYFTSHFQDVVDAVDYASVLAVTDQPLLLDFLSLQGDAYHKLNKNKESDSIYEFILEKDSDYIVVLNNYSYFLAERNEKLDRALELSNRLINLEGNNPTYLDTYAWVLFKNGKYNKALDFINKAIKLDSGNSVYYDHKGDILYKLKKQDEATEMWKKARDLGADSDKLKQKIESGKIIE